MQFTKHFLIYKNPYLEVWGCPVYHGRPGMDLTSIMNATTHH